MVLHTCDNPPCCNPNHLFLGNQDDNMKDMATKGRASRKHGERNGRTVVTTEQVEEIKYLYGTGDFTQSMLSKMYHVDQTQISRIIRGAQRQRG